MRQSQVAFLLVVSCHKERSRGESEGLRCRLRTGRGGSLSRAVWTKSGWEIARNWSNGLELSCEQGLLPGGSGATTAVASSLLFQCTWKYSFSSYQTQEQGMGKWVSNTQIHLSTQWSPKARNIHRNSKAWQAIQQNLPRSLFLRGKNLISSFLIAGNMTWVCFGKCWALPFVYICLWNWNR